MGQYRKIKPQVRAVLAASDRLDRLDELDSIPVRRLTGPLFSLLLDKDQLVGWRAVTAFGRMVARAAGDSLEEGKVLMRMCMWRLNEESGNLGWGVPECMGEAMARHEGLAEEFHSILASYVDDRKGRDGNFLDHPLLRRGVYWGLGRLAEERPGLAAKGRPSMIRALGEQDAVNRASAAWGLVSLLKADAAGEREDEIRVALAGLEDDREPVTLYLDNRLVETSPADMAAAAD